MQRWFFLEDSKNAALRGAGDEVPEEIPIATREQVMPRDWNFRVHVPTLRPDEVVCLTGDVEELGNWRPERCKILEQIEKDVWGITLSIPANKKVHYRYFVGVVVELNKHVIVKYWETNVHPRKIRACDPPPEPNDDPDKFGIYNELTKVDKGWLIKGTIIQLMVCKQPFKLFRPKYENRKINIKVTPVSLVKQPAHGVKDDTMDDSLSNDHHDHYPKFSYTDSASLHHKDTRFKPQGQFGHEFSENEVVIFQSYMLNLANTALLVDIYVYRSKAIDDEPPYHAGFSYILPSVFGSSTGTIILPLTSTKHRPLGELRMEYLVIQPLKAFTCDMQTTFMRYWKKTKHGLDVGHRGSGSSFKHEPSESAAIRENTIASLKTAINHGADYVEFDVQLSKDLTPVIYHDYHVCIAMKKKKTLVDSDMFELPIKALTLEQLRLLKLYHVMEGKTNPRFFDEDLEDHQPFPTLESALDELDVNCGFNIEIKWTNKYMDGTYELDDAIDINLYIDTILKVVLQHGKVRDIVFSSFNPDICTLIRYKQNKYPVLFLTQGETTKFQHYDDPRCWSIKAGVKFVNMIEMLGLSAHTEDILRDPSLVQYGLNAGLIMFCWGDDITDPHTIGYLKKLGLHGVIYDRIYQYNEKRENIYLVEAHDSQKELIRLAAQAAEVAVTPPAPTMASQFPNPLNKGVFTDYGEDLSTATSLASLESDDGELGQFKLP